MKRFANLSRYLSARSTTLCVGALYGSFLIAGNASATITVGPTSNSSCNYSTIQAAINAAASTDTITIASSSTPYKENLAINGKSLSISSCPCNEQVCLYDRINNTIQPAVISGELATTPVMKITGTSTTSLNYITIENGHTGGTDGGGISYNGTGSLTLTNSRVFSNTANYGAGINFKGAAIADTLRIGHDTFVTDNTAAVSGGGIRLEAGTLYAVDKNTWIALNEATSGYGGGIEVLGGNVIARAYIGSPGYLGLPVIDSNTAKYGGGVGVTNQGYLTFFSTDPLQPVAIGSNTAYASGGAIHADFATFQTTVCGQDFRIDDNIAPVGAAIHLNSNSNGGGVQLYLNQGSRCIFPDDVTPVTCAASVACNTMHGNVSADVTNGNRSTVGATLEFDAGAIVFADKLDMRGNQGGRAIYESGNTITEQWYTDVNMHSCLIADNTFSLSVADAESPGTSHLSISNCTIAHNQLGANNVISAGDYVILEDNIIDEDASKAAFVYGSASRQLHAQFNIAANLGDLADDPTSIVAVPTFIDVAHGDYRLKYTKQGAVYSASMGLDFAPAGGGNDIRGMAYDFDLGSLTDRSGTRDLGAYEMHAISDRIFVDAFGDPIQIAF